MHPLSATDAINPAFARARRLLTVRRSWTTALKLGFLALVAEVGASFNTSFGNSFSGQQPQNLHLPPALLAVMAGVAVAAAVFFFVVSLIFFYIGSRLQFVLFDLVLRQDTVVAPSWRMFGPVTWRWLGIRLLITVCALLPFAPILVPAFIRLSRLSATQPQNLNPATFFPLFFGLFGTIMLCMMVLYLATVIVRDFGLPSIIFEKISFGTVFRRAVEPFRIDPGQTLLYLLLRLVLAFAGAMAAEIGLAVVGLISAIPLGIAALIFYLVVHNHGTGGKVLLVMGLAVLALIWVAWMFVLSSMVLGAVQIFLISYSIYFLGGRYSPLGAVLLTQEPQLAYPPGYRPPPPTIAPPPPPPPPAAPPSLTS